MIKIFYSLLLSILFAASSQAQTVVGDWQGTLKAGGAELRLVLHITKGDNNALKATLDSVDQNAMGIPVSSITLNNSTLKLELQDIGGSYEGKVNEAGDRIVGSWSQGGSSLPLEFSRAAARSDSKQRVLKPSDIDGDWEGTLDAGPQKLRLVLHIVTYEDGMSASLDSVDQNLTGLPVTTITRDGAKLKLEMKQLAGVYEGTIDKDLKTITGEWKQAGAGMALTLRRKSAAATEKKPGNSR
jgi:hypothetical protein